MESNANSYAEALFSLAQDEKSEKEYLSSLYDVCSVFRENPEYPVFLSSYTVSKEKRIEALSTAFSASLPENVLSFLCILCEKRNITQLEEITREYEKMYFSAFNISKAYVTSAYPLDNEQSAQLIKKLEEMTGRSVTAEFLTDKSLIGGIKAEIDGRIIDYTVKNRLNKLREVMNK